jgi:hypothetical protein
MDVSAARKRYNLRVIGLGALYAVFLVGAIWGFRHQLFGTGVAYIAAALPALPIVGVFAAFGRYLVEEHDEYVRMLMVRQSLWASGFALSVATGWGFLENFGLVGHIAAYYIAVLWFAGLGLGACINRLTLGAPAHC